MANSSGFGQGKGRQQYQSPGRGPAPGPRQSRTGYVYQERPVEALKERAERTGGRFDSIYKAGFDSWKPKQGNNVIRFLPPTWSDAEHFSLLINVHSYIGPDQGSYLCLKKHFGKPCPICDVADDARRAGEEDEAKKNSVSERALTWIVDRYGDDPTKPQLYQMSWTQDRDIAALCRDPRDGSPIWIDQPDVGFDLAFLRTGMGMKNTKYSGYQIMRDPSPISEDMRVQDQIMQFVIDNPLPTVLQAYPAEYLEKALLGTTHAAADDGAGAGLLHPSQRPDWNTPAQETYEPGVEYSDEPFDAQGGAAGQETGGEAPWEPEPEPEQQRQQFSQRVADQPQERARMETRPQQPQQRATMQPQPPAGGAPSRATMRPPATRLPPPR